jgi:hypothetical protein
LNRAGRPAAGGCQWPVLIGMAEIGLMSRIIIVHKIFSLCEKRASRKKYLPSFSDGYNEFEFEFLLIESIPTNLL